MRTEKYKGNLFWGRKMKLDGKEAVYLVCCPIFKDGTPEYANWGIPEPEKISEEDAWNLKQIAERLGCELY